MVQPEIFKQLGALADPHRAQLLLLLERRELTVSELCAVIQAPQSTVSRHLKVLSDSDWLKSRREGTSHWYSMNPPELAPGLREMWLAVREAIAAGPTAVQHRERLAAVLALRRTRSHQFFSGAAGQWDKLRDQMFGASFFLRALPALIDPDWTVGDLGCGTGPLSETLAPFVRRVIAVDGSGEMLEEARRRLDGVENVDIRQGEVEALPIQDRTLDAAILLLVLHHLPEPERALGEAARVLRPGGRLLLVDMLPHDREEYSRQMGHIWLGFTEQAIDNALNESGFESTRVVRLAVDTDAKGPALFVASATRAGKSETHTDPMPTGKSKGRKKP